MEISLFPLRLATLPVSFLFCVNLVNKEGPVALSLMIPFILLITAFSDKVKGVYGWTKYAVLFFVVLATYTVATLVFRCYVGYCLVFDIAIISPFLFFLRPMDKSCAYRMTGLFVTNTVFLLFAPLIIERLLPAEAGPIDSDAAMLGALIFIIPSLMYWLDSGKKAAQEDGNTSMTDWVPLPRRKSSSGMQIPKSTDVVAQNEEGDTLRIEKH